MKKKISVKKMVSGVNFDSAAAFVKAHKKPVLGAAVGVLALLALCVSCSPKPIGVVDLEKLKNTADIYHLIRQEQGKNENTLNARYDIERRALAQEEQLLLQKQKSMAKEDFQKAAVQLQQKARLIQSAYQMDVERVLGASHTVVQQINQIVLDILPDVAESAGYEVILPKQGVWYASESVDMTDVLVKELNKKTTKLVYPTVEFK